MDQPNDEESAAEPPSLDSNTSWHIDDLLFAPFLFIITVYICNLARDILLQANVMRLDQVQKLATAEIIGTFETTVIMFEINLIVYPLWGVIPYTLLVFIALHWQKLRPDEFQYDANPLTIIMKHVEGIGTAGNSYYQRFEFVMIMIWAETVGAFLSYYYLVNLIWANAHMWGFWDTNNNFHYHLFTTAQEWQASISGDPTFAAFVEGFFSFAQYVWPLLVIRTGFDGDLTLILINSGKAIFAGCGAQYSGGYFNPIIAFALEYKTRGHSLFTKTVVYWIAPIIGTIGGIVTRKWLF
ncbi:unnamed protein product [Orchesella dallaii]|uniref:Uncharacterized protein n=1 Tax=Orchesella dallaii TaxID=48710 RepID=A0ABP1RVY4_9HEXA